MTEAVSGPAASTATRPAQRRRVSDFEQWRIITFHQLGHYLRTNRFYGLFAFAVFVSSLTLAFQLDAGVATVQFQQLYRSSEYLSNYLVYTGLWVVLAAALFGGDALSVDFSTGAGYYMLVLPIRRPVLLAGRYAAATLVTIAVVGTTYAFGAVGASYFFGLRAVPWLLLFESLGVAAVFSLAALSVAFCVSSFIRTPAAGVLFTLVALYVAFTTLEQVVELAQIEPWFSLTYAGGAMAAILDTDFVHVQTIPVGEDQYYYIWSATVIEGLEIMAAYIAVFLPLSAFLYQRKESTG
ncbi:MAG TPA: ABC transporter permease [Thermoplasmata archaeon]|jgi:ABC-type transport system involved in multi-copper enzyme maturation permease subunit|nr:ABC transporter permease [Thermoplasmata archaeon]